MESGSSAIAEWQVFELDGTDGSRCIALEMSPEPERNFFTPGPAVEYKGRVPACAFPPKSRNEPIALTWNIEREGLQYSYSAGFASISISDVVGVLDDGSRTGSVVDVRAHGAFLLLYDADRSLEVIRVTGPTGTQECGVDHDDEGFTDLHC